VAIRDGDTEPAVDGAGEARAGEADAGEVHGKGETDAGDTDPAADVNGADVNGAVDEGDLDATDLGRDLDALVAERDQYLDLARRVQADLENYRKRMVREQTRIVERANAGLVESLLPVLDSFDAALAGIDPERTELAPIRKGVELVHGELFTVLERSGLARIEGMGQEFDPNEHEAVMQDDGDGEPVVAEVLRTGYRLKERVLRPAAVRVTRAGAPAGEPG